MQKKIALINDIAGYGRCAATALLPILSYLGVQACPLPTAIFSNHTAYPNFFRDDYTDRMEVYIENWKKLGLTFDGIATGYLGSVRQVEIVCRFIQDFSKEETLVLVDPVMGDQGRIYSACTEELCKELRKLMALADIVTPNLTESCHLAGVPYRERGWKQEELRGLAERLAQMGSSRVVITGIPQGAYIANYVYERVEGQTAKSCLLRVRKVGEARCGTGDVFAAVLAGDALNGVPFARSVKKASGFVKRCLLAAMELQTPAPDGMPFEEVLHRLKRN